MKRKPNIWVEVDGKKYYSVTKFSKHIILDLDTCTVKCICETFDNADLTINNKKYKILESIDVHSLCNLAELFKSRSVRFKKQ